MTNYKIEMSETKIILDACCGSVLIAFGRENAEILRNCSLQGKYVELNNDK